MTVQTQPRTSIAWPVRSIRVDVTRGTDAGATFEAASERITVGTANGNDLVLQDKAVSRYHVELLATAQGVSIVDHGSTNGTFVGAMRVERGVVPAGTTITVGETQFVVAEGATRRVPLHHGDRLGVLLGKSPAMRRLMADVERAAAAPAAVLVAGESGTGKELVATALHELSPRAEQPFVVVDCGALSRNLVESELYGHERGAFTGADRRHIGAFERAHGGTLFLDEIGELPADLQPTLLGVLERRRLRRVGGASDISVDVRVVCATHRDLRAHVNSGAFRLDLFYRIAVVQLSLPPLRERKEDLDLLLSHFLAESGDSRSAEHAFSKDELVRLRAYPWPGNVRELRNYVEAFVAMGQAQPLDAQRAPVGGAPAAWPESTASLFERPYRDARHAVVSEFEAEYARRVVHRTRGNVSAAAREAKMNRSYLIDILRRHGIATS